MLSFSFTRNTGYTFPSLISIFLVFLFLLFSEVKAGNNYYISSTSGDDSRTSIQARNPATPWKTISKLNSVFNSLAAGDSILFKRGEIYTGTITPTLSGTLVSPIIISSFGIGTKPIINGFETISGWISEGSGIYSKVITVQSTPNMVTVNGINTSLGRYPKTGYLTIDSHVTNTTITDSDLNSAITNWTGAEVVIRKWNWVIDRSLITNHSGSTITYTSGSTNNAQNGYGYFIQNDLRCLTELGDWAYKSGKLYMYFGVNNPDSFVVKVSTLNKAIDISSKSNITLLNLEIQGNNIAGVYVSASSHIIVDNCDINYSGTNAITAIGSSTYLTVSNSKITNSNNKAISLAYGCTYSTIKNNTITKTGLFAGMGNNATISGSSSTMFSAITLSDAHNGLVENNNITNTGYIGICFYANNVTVNKNYIDTFCIVADDGGGIYTGVGTYIGRKISNNIVINGIGAPAGATGTTGDANGIYLDYNASNVEVYNNTVAFCSAAGIYIHNGHENNVHDNLIYGTANQLQLIQNSVDDQIRNNVIQHNSFIINSLSQTLIKESSAVNDILSFGKFSGNYYINIFKDERVSYMTYITAAKSYKKSYSYYRWLSEIDTTGKKSPLTLPLYKINSLIGTNKFTNGTFNTGVTNFSKSYSGTSTISWDNTNKINAGSAKYSISSLSTDFNESLLSGNIGPVNAGTVYEAKFSLVSTKKNRILRVKLIENLAPYRVASIEQFVTFSDTITNQKIQITPTLSLSSAKLYFFVDDDDSELYVDNIEFYEANATIVNPEDFLRFEYNATNSNSFITLAEPYLGIDNKVYSGSLSLLPYTSIILFRTTDTIINKKPFIQNQNIQLNENTPNGTTIGTVLASDPDAAQSLSYSILSGNTNGAFAINSSTGVLSVANSAALNFESTPSFALVVKVQDNGTGTLSSQATVTATLLDVNEAPVISNQSFSVTENSANGSTAGTVVASDPDAAQTKTFSILSGNTNGAFAINASTGVLSVTNSAALNFESAPSFALVVKVQDNGTGTLSSQATVTISLIDANEAPVINNQSFSVAENSVNGSTAGTVVATDPDAAQTKTFSILSGNTNGAFAINSSTGVLSVANSAALNFESTPSFALVVKVQDNGTGTLSSQATVTATLLDVNEAPVISNQSFSVTENSANGSTAGTVVASDPDAAQTKTFSILSGNTNGAFAINASTGVLSVTNSAALNFESAPSFALVVKVQDNGTGTLSSQATVTISLIDANEAPVINNQSFSVAENSVNGSTAGTVVATDPDAAQTKTFSILSGNTNGAFAINASTGVLSVANSAALNFESTPSFSLIVKVQDNGTGTLSSQATVTTTLLDVNEAPVISNQSFSVAENSANGTTAGTVVASDPDAAQTKTFSILSGNTNGAFAINASTGVLSVTNSAALNFESAPSFALVVKVQDNGTGTLSSQATVTISLIDANEAPVINNQSFSVAEYSVNGSTAGTVVATDPDAAQTKTFSILSGNTNGAFAINSSTGVLSVANSAALNFESTPSFSLIVKVQDNGTGTLSSQATVTTTLLDVNEAPVISNQSFSVAENSANGTTAGTVVASDPDAAQNKTFSILSGNTNGAFAINASTGVLSVTNSAALNFESAPSFALVVKVQDNGTGTLSSQATVTVTLLDVNEAPIISNQSFSVAENSANGSTAGTVVASDPDAAQTKTFSILSGNTNGAFVINSSTGVLSVANSAALNFESTPSFALVVKVQDNGTGTLSSQATVTATLLDVNEAPIISNQSFSVAENSANGSTAGTVVASDPDAAQTKTFSILSGNTNGAFVINSSTGVLSVANSAALNFESAPSFALVVKVQDNGTGTLSSQATVTVSLLDINETPVISNQSFSVAENSANGSTAGTVVASDPDVAQTKTFSILSGNTNGAFTINASTGVLSVANSAALNFESAPSFALVIKVQDNGTGTLSSQATVTVSLLDINETPVISNQSFSVAENSANGTTAGTVIASDPDAAQTKTFSILSGNTNGAFAINASTGVLSIANSAAINFESAPSFALVVKVQDNGTGALSSQATVSISLTDVNEAPVISNQSFSVAENSANGTNIGTVVASDPDAAQTKTFSILSGNTNDAFTINSSTGVLSVANSAALNFESAPSFALVVKVQDNGTGALSSQATVSISLTDVNEAPVISNQSFSVAENSANGINIGTAIASDPDAAQTKTFSILSGNTNGAFAINASTGVLSVANSPALNFESAPSFALVIKVQDNGTGTLSNQATVSISLTDVNEAPVISNQTFSVMEFASNSTSVGTVYATDPDANQSLSYFITSGNTGNAFSINILTGELIVANNTALDFSINPTFLLTIKITDNGTGNLSDLATITIAISQEPNQAPVISNQSFSVAENSANGTNIGTVVASDPDAAQTKTFSILSGNTNGAFAINASTGVLAVANSAALNFESAPSFSLIVKVQDNGTGTLSNQATVTISLTDINEAPVISNQSFSVTENSANGSTAGTVVASDPDAAQTKTFSILSGNTNGAFIINASTGVLSVANSAALNFESAPSFSLVVKVQDNGTGTLSNQAAVTISLTDVNEAPVISNQSFSVAENSANGSTAGTVVASDPDAAQTKTFSILSGNTNGAFAINASTGVLSVTNSAALNFESVPSFSLVIKVQDNGTGALSNQATVTISLTDVNEAPVISNQTFSVMEFASNSTSVGIVNATDQDADQSLSYFITSGNTGNAFSIDILTGELIVANNTALDFSINPTFLLSIKVTDNGTGNLSDLSTITITISQGSNQAPVISNQSFSVPENSANGTTIGTVVASDPDAAQTKTFSILSGNTDSAFAINASTGVLSVANSAALNFESAPSFALVVKVQDNGTGTLSNQATVTITLTDVNEEPVISNQSFSVVENSTNGANIGTVIAADPDVAQTLSYFIIYGNINHIFSINPSTGELILVDSAAINQSINSSIVLGVAVFDNGSGYLFNIATISINVLPASNKPPVINDQVFPLLKNSAIGTSVGIIKADDPNQDQTLNFDIYSGNSDGIFTINATTGELFIADTTALVLLSNDSVQLVIKVQDNGSVPMSSQAKITVFFSSNDAPVILSQTINTLEHQPIGTKVGTILATDPNSNNPLTYSIIAGNIGNSFTIDANTGCLNINNPVVVCFEGHPVFNLSVKVQDNVGLSSEAIVTINVEDINEQPVCPDQTFSLSENDPAQTFVGSVIAKDFDFNQTLTYSIISGNLNDAFKIDPGNGSIYVNNPAPINFEENNTFNLEVSIQDNGIGLLKTFANITIEVLDVNEPPVLENQILSVVENSAPGTKIGYVKANDPDKGQKIKYKIVAGDESHTFNLSDTTGLISVADPSRLFYGHNALISLTVIAQDNGIDSLSTLSVVSIDIVKDSTKIVTTGIDKISTSETFSENDISIYPNPTTDIVNIDLGKVINQPVGIRIFSINGSEVYSAIRTGEKNVAINMGNEKPGTYIASLDLNGQIYTKNIIVKN